MKCSKKRKVSLLSLTAKEMQNKILGLLFTSQIGKDFTTINISIFANTGKQAVSQPAAESINKYNKPEG